MEERDWKIGSLIPGEGQEDASDWRIDSLIPAEPSDNDADYISALFRDVGMVPQREEQQPKRPKLKGPPVQPVETDAPALAPTDANADGNGDPGGDQDGRGRKEAVAITSEPVRPFFENVLSREAGAGSAEASGGKRWRALALSVVGFVALGGIAAAVLNFGYQLNARDSQVVRAGAPVRPAAAPEPGLTEAVIGGDLEPFQGCTSGDGLSPLGLIVVARNYVTSTPPVVCLPADKPRKKPPSEAGATGSADQTTTSTLVTTTPTGSSGSGGAAPATGGGTGGDEPTPAPPPPPPPDGGTTEPDKPGNGWGKGGKPEVA